MEVYFLEKKINLNQNNLIGLGGEAEIYAVGEKAIKIFKTPEHPDFENLTEEQNAARRRLNVHQEKLKKFPKNLPAQVITPEELIEDRNGKIIGYAMKLLKKAEVLWRYYGSQNFRQGVPKDAIVKIFLNLRETLSVIHSKEIVIGDFNDLNVLVDNLTAYIIDADSFQFAEFTAQVFTPRFLDPLLCGFNVKELVPAKPPNKNSDWYAFNIMLMQTLLFIGPYGGIYKPKEQRKRVLPDKRPIDRITIFNPEVVYPKSAIHYSFLPDELINHFELVFKKDKRGEFPESLLTNLHPTKCKNCGLEHFRQICPKCHIAKPQIIKETVIVKGELTANRIFRTNGAILCATLINGKPNWLFHENGEFKRENSSIVKKGVLEPHLRFRIFGNSTIIAKTGEMMTLTPGRKPEKISVENYGLLPIFDANSLGRYWLQNGELTQDGEFGPERIGTIIQGKTLFWAGEKFGFGFWRLGNLMQGFTFEFRKNGINDNVKLPRFNGKVIDSATAFSDQFCWFFTISEENKKIMNRVSVINKNGQVEAEEKLDTKENSWFSGIRGKVAVGKFLFSATDEGITRLEFNQGRIAETKKFPNTEPFVDSNSWLFAANDGIYAVNGQEIYLLTIR